MSKILGKNYEGVVSLFSLIAVFGAAMVYWVLMSNFLYNTVDFLKGESQSFQ